MLANNQQKELFWPLERRKEMQKGTKLLVSHDKGTTWIECFVSEEIQGSTMFGISGRRGLSFFQQEEDEAAKLARGGRVLGPYGQQHDFRQASIALRFCTRTPASKRGVPFSISSAQK